MLQIKNPVTDQQKQNLQEASKAAVLAEEQTGCPAIITVAQWALESGWGEHQPGNNPFGIKAHQGLNTNGFQELPTKEFEDGHYVLRPEEFATYATLADAFTDHGTLLAKREPYARWFESYQAYKNTPDAIYALIGLVASRYATDPLYAFKVLALLPQIKPVLDDTVSFSSGT